MAESAQAAFARMIKDEVAPALRRLGFKGSGRRFELPFPAGWAMLGFQKSTWSDATRVRFTINLRVVERSHWEREREERPYFPERPSPSTFYGVDWEARIGQVMPGDLDRWWTVAADAPTEPVAGEIVGVVQDFALPAMRERMARARVS